ncbi:hypothetical protein JL100_014770 [Skermanella mucosa]|uniref:hypothetical protein n=1 Tax=Skermanella mucosa TaxID=1789672 RepID=UPI00192B3189|nr:hypothetical protein [Skermanella mucosa]UEM23943.1 hypothetical protein JL100_014770 [Skermanella mucosa]
MSDSYTNAKVREALVASQGSRARAQDILLGWAQADDRLLRGLVTPYLKGIVTGTVERVTRAGSGSAAMSTPAPAVPKSSVPKPTVQKPAGRPSAPRQLSPEALDKALSMMGQGVPPRPAAAPPPRSAGALKLGTTNPVPPTKAGAKHQQTMRALAALYARKHQN